MLKNVIENLEKSPIFKKYYYIYIPFENREDTDELEIMAVKWKSNIAKKDKNKIPKVILYKKNGLKDISNDAVIYITAHTVESLPHKICNMSDPENKNFVTINMQELANRMKVDGLDPNKSAKLKLYFCDESHSIIKMKDEFITNLGPSYANYDVCYYPSVSLSYPLNDDSTGEIHKYAYM
jgi:hypothetical protein